MCFQHFAKICIVHRITNQDEQGSFKLLSTAYGTKTEQL